MSGWNAVLRGLIVALAFGASLPFGCDSSDPGSSGETHFVACTSDADCTKLGANYACIARECQVDTDAANASGGVASGGGGGTGGTSVVTGSGGTGATENDGGGNTSSGGRQGGTGGNASATGGTTTSSGTGGGPTSSGGSTPSSGADAGDAGPSRNDGGDASDSGQSAGIDPPELPVVAITCPTLATGTNLINVSGTNSTWNAWVGADNPSGRGGPIVVYWPSTSGTGTGNDTEAATVLGQSVIDAIESEGGIVIAPTETVGTGTCSAKWCTGDVAFADQIVACAIQQQHIDVRRIYTAGFVYGALEATYMWYARSGYIASVVAYAGGNDGNLAAVEAQLEDAAYPPPAVVVYPTLQDNQTFNTFSTNWETSIKGVGGFQIDCASTIEFTDANFYTSLSPAAWQFLKDHPYGVKPEPYKSLPSGWPSYCSIR